jgi:hypothetical protein
MYIYIQNKIKEAVVYIYIYKSDETYELEQDKNIGKK